MASPAILSTRAALSFTERQFMLIKRYWGWEAMFLVYTLCSTLAIGYLAAGLTAQGTVQGAEAQQRITIYLLVGTLLWGYLSTLFWELSAIMGWERWEGTIEYTFMAPVPRFAHLFGMCIYAILYALARTGATLLIVVLMFTLAFQHANWIGALSVLLVGTVSFVGIGILVAILPLLAPEKGQMIAGAIEGIMLLISGVYYPIEVLPTWMQWAARLSPATYTLHGIRASLVEGAGFSALANDLLVLGVMGVVAVPLGMWLFGVAETYCKRTGRLKRSG
ncbi:MAG: ABC transporter permease [Fimbriimonadia bacterium]|jgi:ABC-2 type transport system permease protein